MCLSTEWPSNLLVVLEKSFSIVRRARIKGETLHWSGLCALVEARNSALA